MKTTNILHITDLHFGSSISTPMATLADTGISSTLASEITSPDCRERFIIDIKHSFPNISIDAIICTGDLGWKAIEEYTKLGTEYLLKLSQILQVEPDHVIVCPGNHDLDRNASRGEELDVQNLETQSE